MPSSRVSIIMSVYNGERYLAAAIESILAQTYQEFELLLIDDGSTDSSRQIIQRYESDVRIRVISQSNRGLVAALNRGIAETRSELLARMDADDLSMPDRLERQVAFLDAHPEVALVGSSFRAIDESDRAILDIIVPCLHHDLWRRMYMMSPFPHGGVMMRRAVIEQLGGYRDCYAVTEDYDLWRRMAAKNQVANLPHILYLYRYNSQGLSSSNLALQASEAKRIQDELWHQIRFPSWSLVELCRTLKFYLDTDTPLRRQLLDDYVQSHYDNARALVIRGRRRTAFAYLFGALLLNPLKAWRKFRKRYGLRVLAQVVPGRTRPDP